MRWGKRKANKDEILQYNALLSICQERELKIAKQGTLYNKQPNFTLHLTEKTPTFLIHILDFKILSIAPR